MPTSDTHRLELMLDQSHQTILRLLEELEQVRKDQWEWGVACGFQQGWDACERDMAEHWAVLARKTVADGSRAIDQNNATVRRQLERELAATRRSLHLAQERNAELEAATDPGLERRNHAGLVRPTDRRAA